ncbi:hypothetical protein Aperf_G00000122801 [Anoplocephala perfoliata]
MHTALKLWYIFIAFIGVINAFSIVEGPLRNYDGIPGGFILLIGTFCSLLIIVALLVNWTCCPQKEKKEIIPPPVELDDPNQSRSEFNPVENKLRYTITINADPFETEKRGRSPESIPPVLPPRQNVLPSVEPLRPPGIPTTGATSPLPPLPPRKPEIPPVGLPQVQQPSAFKQVCILRQTEIQPYLGCSLQAAQTPLKLSLVKDPHQNLKTVKLTWRP